MRLKTPAVLFLVLICSALFFQGCGYNKLQRYDEKIKSSWAEVVNQYKRRADLVPNLVNVVKGYASHEKEVLENVTASRAKVGSVTVTPELVGDAKAFAEFQSAQQGLSSALSRLLAVAENYPDLKADGVFRDLQAQLEGTENRITVARGRYISAVEKYNVIVRSFPSNLTANYFGYTTKPTFSVENEKEISTPPTVEFSILGANQNARILICEPVSPGGTTHTRRTSYKGRSGPFHNRVWTQRCLEDPGIFICGEYT